MGIDSIDPKAWKLVGHMGNSAVYTGRENINAGTINTKNQNMTVSVSLQVYQLLKNDQSEIYDYYLVAGTYFHGISGSPSDPSTNWFSVGYYANYMELTIETKDEAQLVEEFGPNSTVGTTTQGFSIGGGIASGVSSDKPYAVGNVSAAVSFSFSTPDVTFAARPGLRAVQWRADLPHVGWTSPAVPANPRPASYSGYGWNPGVIFRVPACASFNPKGSCKVEFEFDYTRGTCNDTKGETIALTYVPDTSAALSAGAGAPPAPIQKLPTILQALAARCADNGKPGITDTYLAALQMTGINDHFNDNNAMMVVHAPSNAAIATYMDELGIEAARFTSAFSIPVIENFLRERIAIADNADMEKIGKSVATDGNTVVHCRDGILIISDQITPPKEMAGLVGIY